MARRESIVGGPGAGDEGPAPWETGGDSGAVAPQAAPAVVEAPSDVTEYDTFTKDVDRALEGVVTPGRGVTPEAREEALRRLAAKRQETAPVVTYGPAVQRLIEELRESAQARTGDALGVYEDVISRIEKATTADDVLAGDDVVDAEDILKVSLQLWDVSVNESDYRDNLGAYVALRAVRQDTMEDVVVTCGAVKVVAKAMKLKRINTFPVMVMLVKSERTTAAGYHVMDLVKG